MACNAIVARITVTPVEGAKTLAQGHVLGYSVAVDNSTETGQLGLFFPTDGELSEQFATANDLVARGVDELGNKLGGYFSEKRRVTTQKFMSGKIRSEGYFCPLTSLLFTGYDINKLKEGDTFSELNGVPICKKYVTEATLRAQKEAARQGKKKLSVLNFPEHVDTAQFKHIGQQIPAGSLIFISEKVHGTSGRFGNVPVELKPKWYKRFANWLAGVRDPVEYKNIIGTRRTVVNDVDGGFYGSHDFRKRSVDGINLKKDEVLYFELVGYTGPDKPIMADQDVTKLNDKAFIQAFGKTMRYKYGCADGECRLYVYRITQNGVELSHMQVQKRAKELGLLVVPSLCAPIVYNGDYDWLVSMVKTYTDGRSTLDPSHIREGIVLRIENDTETRFIKNKSEAFGILEGYLKSNDNYVDTEEAV